MKNYDQQEINEIVDCMYYVDYVTDQIIIKEGEDGKHMYVLEGACMNRWDNVFERAAVECLVSNNVLIVFFFYF